MKTIILIFAIFSGSIFSQGVWVQTGGIPQGAGVTDMVITSQGTVIVTTASYNWPNGQPGGIRRSTDNGDTWTNALNCYNARTLCIGYNGVIYASAWNYPSNEGLYRSTNDGANWGQVYPLAANNDNIFAIATKVNNNPIFLGTRNGVRRSVDGGFSFPLVNNGIPANTWIRDLEVSPDGNYIAAGTTRGLFISSNNGDSWQLSAGSGNDTIVWVVFLDNSAADNSTGITLFAGSNDGELMRAAEESQFLQILTLALFDSSELVDGWANGEQLLIARYPKNPNSGGVNRSTNGGTNFTQINEGLPVDPRTSSMATTTINRNALLDVFVSLFENTSNGGRIFRRTFPIGIQQITSEVPNGFSLSQNYPNPFNPVTNIRFQIPKSSSVRLVIYDMRGREIETLVNKQLIAGVYQADWNASNYSSGVYFYKLTTEEFSETKKMILTK